MLIKRWWLDSDSVIWKEKHNISVSVRILQWYITIIYSLESHFDLLKIFQKFNILSW